MNVTDKYNIRTGVVGVGKAPTYVWDDMYGKEIDGWYEEHTLNCRVCYGGDVCELMEGGVEGGTRYVGFRAAKNGEEPDLEFEGTYGKTGYVFDEDSDYSAVVTESDIHVIRSDYVMITERTFTGTYPNQGNLEQPSTKPLSPVSDAIDETLGNIISGGITGHSNIMAWTAMLMDNNKTATLSWSLPPDLYDEEYDDIDTSVIIPVSQLESVLEGGGADAAAGV